MTAGAGLGSRGSVQAPVPAGSPRSPAGVSSCPAWRKKGSSLSRPTRDPHLSWAGGISRIPFLPPLSLPAHKGSAWTRSWLLLDLSPTPALCVRVLARVLPQDVPLGCVGVPGNCGGDLAVPRATTLLPGDKGLGLCVLGLHVLGLQGKVKSWGGLEEVPAPVPSPCCTFTVVEGEGGPGLERPCAGSARAGLGFGVGTASAAPPSLLCKADSLALS